jgi:HEPN domain-containing protein
LVNRSKDWLNQARRDLEKAKLDLAHFYYEWACFTAQQSSEKAVKALYLSLNRHARGHAVLKLLEGLSGTMHIPDDLYHAARLLDRYYIESRYPNGFPQGSPADYFDAIIAQEAYDAARAILGFCEDSIGEL